MYGQGVKHYFILPFKKTQVFTSKLGHVHQDPHLIGWQNKDI